MDKAKAAISDFMSKDGKHRTTVDQDHSKAITEEHVRPHQHENLTTAVDREVHKDHHYTTVQPITHKETLPEQHHHNLIPVEHKTIDHGGHDEMSRTIERDAAQYQDTTTTHKTTQSHTAAPTVTGEHVHHHVHEHVQPVIHKETIQPHVVHTTVPVHETHHVSPVHHGTKIAPTKTLDEFTTGGGILEGKATKALHEYDGCPQTESGVDHSSHHHSKTAAAGLAGATAGGLASDHHKAGATAGAVGAGAATHHHNKKSQETEDVSNLANTLGTNRNEGSMFGKDKVSGLTHSVTSPTNPTQTVESRSYLNQERKGIRETDLAGDNYQAGSKLDNQTAVGGAAAVPRSEKSTTGGMEPWHAGETHQMGEQPVRKASLVDRLNPLKDSDGDGKKGFMK